MRYLTFLIAALFLACSGCEKENFLRYSNSQRALKLLPTVGDNGIRFFNLFGDTITIKVKAKSSVFETAENVNQQVGGTDGISKLELEKNSLVLGSDTPYYRFNYSVQATQDASQGRGARDEFQLTWEDENSMSDSKLSLSISDSIRCTDTACIFNTPLSFGNGNSFTNLYFTPRTVNTNTRIFINETQGLVAFTLANGQTYQRVP